MMSNAFVHLAGVQTLDVHSAAGLPVVVEVCAYDIEADALNVN